MSILFNKDTLFSVDSEKSFDDLALTLYSYHREHNPTYKTFLNLFCTHLTPQNWREIPCMPVSFFKTHNLYIPQQQPEVTFRSSGTTGANTSRHHVSQINDYHDVCEKGFEGVYGSLNQYAFCCLLPSYLERTGASLIEMCRYFIEQSGAGGFYLDNINALFSDIQKHKTAGKQVVLIGVSFALLDLVDCNPDRSLFKDVLVMETGGMKGRRKELTRMALHEAIMNGLGVNQVASEYGMTELMSQAYAKDSGLYVPPNWMRVAARHVHDPRDVRPSGRPGLLNIIDLANVHSMPFIAVDDIGVVHENGTFEVLGRYDSADVRGCNLMVL